jgi:hypothetical protein
MRGTLWDEWAEMSVTHRDVHDPDVAMVLRLVQREAEIDRLRSAGRLLNASSPSRPAAHGGARPRPYR